MTELTTPKAPLTTILTRRDAEKFWNRVSIDLSSRCWVVGNGHYKSITRFGDRVYKSSHVAWALTFGEDIPLGLELCHHCDNNACVRPTHMFVGTHADNMRDRDQKGRGRPPWTGKTFTAEHRAKLSAAAMGNTRTLGFRASDETRAKMSVSQRRRFARERAARHGEYD